MEKLGLAIDDVSKAYTRSWKISAAKNREYHRNGGPTPATLDDIEISRVRFWRGMGKSWRWIAARFPVSRNTVIKIAGKHGVN